ncbi:MAG: tetratricopeptide repeat protein [Spirochaetales bacterium]|nr:tetratricopeptide repeat protein [Spirochaetales bacterium]
MKVKCYTDHPMTDIQKKFRQALRHGTAREYKKAVSLLLEVLAAGDSITEAYLYLGRAYHALGDAQRAILYLSFFTDRCPEEAAGWFFLGRSYLHEGLVHRAIEAFTRASGIKPEEPSHYGYLGMAYLRVKDFDQASDYFAKAVELDPDNSKIFNGYLNTLFLKGIRLFFDEQYDISNQIFTFIHSHGRDDALIHLYLAKSYKQLGELDEALTHYDAAVACNPDDEAIRIQRAYLLFLTGNHAQANEEFEVLGRSHPELQDFQCNDSYLHSVLGVRYFSKKEYRKAAYHGVQALKIQRTYDLHILVGESYRNLGDREKARNHYKRAAEFNREALEPHYGILMSYWEEGDYQAAHTTLTRILAMNPDDELGTYYMTLTKCQLEYPPEETIPLVQEQLRTSGPDPFLLTALGNQYIRTDLFDLAPKWFDKALTLAPQYEPALYGRILAFKGLQDKPRLFSAYSSYLEQAGYSASVHLNYIHDLFLEHRYVDAAKEVELILPKAKIDDNLKRLLAICYRNTKKYKEAAIIYRQLLVGAPKNETYLRSLLFCLDKASKRKDAIRILETAFGFFPPSAALYLIGGVLYEKDQDYEKALEAFRKAAELNPKDWKAPHNMGTIYIKKGMAAFGGKYLKKAEKLREENEKP